MVEGYSYQKKDTLIKIDNVSLSFGDKVILKPISMEVKDIVREGCITGQIVGIIGRSGIGKSTLAKILTGLIKPSTGSIYIGNKKIEAGMVGYVAQNYPLFNHRTVIGNLLVALEKANISKLAMKDRIKEYLIRFNLQDTNDLYPSSLSGGMRQRIAIIQQLLCSEHYLVMDEPFSGLDVFMKDEVCKLITTVANLHEENTIFVIAHDIESLVNISDHLWILGVDKDTNGNIIPGAYIKKEYNLIDRGFCWNKNTLKTQEIALFVNEIKKDLL
jgi:ABC-type nitrate/sulfonate/bicarbonate transport system ATPase subunit